MAKRTIVVSDLNGEEIGEEDSATVTISWPNRDKVRVLEITAKEADELFGTAGVEKAKRGRKPADAATTNGDGAGDATKSAPKAKSAPAAS